MKVVFRADAYRAIGTGHIMRCLALAQGCLEMDMEVVFLTFCEDPGLIERLSRESFKVTYRCYSICMFPGTERQDVERGGKSKYEEFGGIHYMHFIFNRLHT